MCLGGCGSLSPRSDDPHQTTSIEQTPEAIQANQQLSAAQQSIKNKDWPAALAELQSIVDVKSFDRLPVDLRYQALSAASRVAIYHGPRERGYKYLQRVIAMPQAGFVDWREQLRFAERTANPSAAARRGGT
jgi:hypothetical protein